MVSSATWRAIYDITGSGGEPGGRSLTDVSPAESDRPTAVLGHCQCDREVMSQDHSSEDPEEDWEIFLVVVWWCPDGVWDCCCLVALSQPSQHGLRITGPPRQAGGPVLWTVSHARRGEGEVCRRHSGEPAHGACVLLCLMTSPDIKQMTGGFSTHQTLSLRYWSVSQAPHVSSSYNTLHGLWNISDIYDKSGNTSSN